MNANPNPSTQRTFLRATDTSGGKGVSGLTAKLSAISLALLIPTITYAAKPSATTDVGCAVLAPAQIYQTDPFTAKNVRVPRYPGGWSQPTITVKVTYPPKMAADAMQSDLMQIAEQTIQRHNVTYALATFTPDPNFEIESGGTATIEATVREPLTKGRSRDTVCTSAWPTVY
jgi:hypothetical protein